jgi:hypothetical protein
VTGGEAILGIVIAGWVAWAVHRHDRPAVTLDDLLLDDDVMCVADATRCDCPQCVDREFARLVRRIEAS